mmetsp:Transcript_22248/g.56163  ORF Transcript_22248/g.56163 Transcript_22248/m.56163 type:complete len:325 (-) Transcript_22248:619-1593(-)
MGVRVGPTFDICFPAYSLYSPLHASISFAIAGGCMFTFSTEATSFFHSRLDMPNSFRSMLHSRKFKYAEVVVALIKGTTCCRRSGRLSSSNSRSLYADTFVALLQGSAAIAKKCHRAFMLGPLSSRILSCSVSSNWSSFFMPSRSSILSCMFWITSWYSWFCAITSEYFLRMPRKSAVAISSITVSVNRSVTRKPKGTNPTLTTTYPFTSYLVSEWIRLTYILETGVSGMSHRVLPTTSSSWSTRTLIGFKWSELSKSTGKEQPSFQAGFGVPSTSSVLQEKPPGLVLHCFEHVTSSTVFQFIFCFVASPMSLSSSSSSSSAAC